MVNCVLPYANPSTLFVSERGLSVMDGRFRISVGGIDAVLHRVSGILHVFFQPVSAIREIVGGLGDVASSFSLRTGVLYQFGGLGSPRDHLVQLPSEYEAGHDSDNDPSPSQANHRPLKSRHSFFYACFGLFELLSGCWLSWISVPRLGYNGRSLVSGCACLIGGMILAIHGGFLLLLTVWEGIVEVFELIGHPKASKMYAWAHDTDDPAKPTRYVTILHLHPVTSPQAAVRAAVVREYRNLGTAEQG